MSIFRSRNILSSTMDKNSFNSITFRKELNLTTYRLDKNKKILKKRISEPQINDEIVKNILKHNKFLKEQLSSISTKNTNIKNIMRRILSSNKDSNHKNNIISYLKEYNELLLFNNKNMKLEVKKYLDKYKLVESDINNKIGELVTIKEEKEKTKFLLENDTQRKNNFIKIYSKSLKNIGTVQESVRFRYLNDEIFQNDIDNYYSKYLEIYRKNLLQTTQRWNKFKNKAIKNKKEISELKKLLRNPKEIKKKQILEEQKNSYENNINLTTEGDNDIFLIAFDEFEDEFEPDFNEQELSLNNDLDNINNNDVSNNNKTETKNFKNLIEKETKEAQHKKINNRNTKKYSSNSIDIKIGNKINYAKKDLYYFPQNNYSKSIIQDKTDSPRIKSNRNVSINSISKLNFKQILFNKNARYMKEEAQDLALKKYEIENENELSKNDYGNKDDLIIRDLKKDIKTFNNKNRKKKKIIKEFKKFCNEFYIKYQRYMNSITNNKEL